MLVEKIFTYLHRKLEIMGVVATYSLVICYAASEQCLCIMTFPNENGDLVDGLEHFLWFHILGTIIPTDEVIFFRRYTNHQPVIDPPLSEEVYQPPTSDCP